MFYIFYVKGNKAISENINNNDNWTRKWKENGLAQCNIWQHDEDYRRSAKCKFDSLKEGMGVRTVDCELVGDWMRVCLVHGGSTGRRCTLAALQEGKDLLWCPKVFPLFHTLCLIVFLMCSLIAWLRWVATAIFSETDRKPRSQPEVLLTGSSNKSQQQTTRRHLGLKWD